MLAAPTAADGGGGVGGEAAGRLVVGAVARVEVQLAAVQVVHALVRTRRVGRVWGGDLKGERDKFQTSSDTFVENASFCLKL